MSLSKTALAKLTPSQALATIKANVSTESDARSTVLYSTKDAHSLEAFQQTKIIVSAEDFELTCNYEAEQLTQIESFYVYGAYITANGKVGGCAIEKHKDNDFICIVTIDSVCTANLVEAEQFLYENWYKHECVD